MVEGAARQRLAAVEEGEGEDGAGVALQRLDARARLGVPEADGLVERTARQRLAVAEEGEGEDGAGVALQRLDGGNAGVPSAVWGTGLAS